MRSTPQHKLSKSAIKAWRLALAIFCCFLLFIPLLLSFWPTTGFSLWIIIALTLTLLVGVGLIIFFVPEIRWQHWYYQFDEHEIDLQSGIFIITRTLVPIKRVQHVDTRQGPILRSYGLADVTISTAATTHRIPALDEETADNVRDQISKFARLAQEDV